MPAKLTLVEFAEMLADHKTKDLIEMLYLRMSEDDLMEMAAEHDAERCVECGEVVEDEDGWTDSKGKQYCGDCKDQADNYEAEDEECAGDEADYEYQECCDAGCKYKGHYVKKTETDKTDGRTDGEDEERKWASHFVKNEALSS
jgi:hypothetical protein